MLKLLFSRNLNDFYFVALLCERYVGKNVKLKNFFCEMLPQTREKLKGKT